MIDGKRIERLNNLNIKPGTVFYWMSRDQRISDNWALLKAQDIAIRMKEPLAVIFTLGPSFLGATMRQYSFMLEGLVSLEKKLERLNIPLFLLSGNPPDEIIRFLKKNPAGALLTDFSPLKIQRQWKEKSLAGIKTAFLEIDSHNIVPCRIASDKQEFSARTMRPKIHRLLPQFLERIPAVRRHPFSWKGKAAVNDFKRLYATLKVDDSVGKAEWAQPGEDEALKALRNFIVKRLDGYDSDRNNPLVEGQSNLSPYLHFGQISAQRIAFEVQEAGAELKSTEAFIEELVVRRELAENFCSYNKFYDSFEGLPAWAKKTLDAHRGDIREYKYSREIFESALTHDGLWNAAQKQMVRTGKMHGYVRMYWAKKILEWNKTPEEALSTAIYLNDRYELDGRDPNGYAGILWSVGGLHDRPWFSRPVFGAVRYMSRRGMESRFDVGEYIKRNL